MSKKSVSKKRHYTRIGIHALLAKYPYFVIFFVFVAGIVFWGGFNTALEVTNTEEFCISCHEMKDYIYSEYKETIHYANTTGVRATCPDCHVPREWIYKIRRKIAATNELYHKVAGTIDTPEKFKKRRLHLASRVWRIMKKTDSRECRNCHAFNYMELNRQSALAKEKHLKSIRENQTCIDCHMGIAHHIPEDFDSDGKIHKQFKKEGRSCGDCHKGMARSEDGW